MGLIGFLVLLVLALVLLVVYAAQNTASDTVYLWQYHWSGVPRWLPAAVAAAVIALLFFLYMGIAGTSSRLERGRLRGRVRRLEEELGGHREENERLRGRVGEPAAREALAAEEPRAGNERQAEGERNEPAPAHDTESLRRGSLRVTARRCRRRVGRGAVAATDGTSGRHCRAVTR
jgi:uncharacterized integral membrane protein